MRFNISQFRQSFQKLDWNQPLLRIISALTGSILMRFPYFSFQVAVANLQQKTLWQNNFQVSCISDCRIYGELSTGYDRTGLFTWTYFPIWPNLIKLFRKLLPIEISGYSAAVILSWVTGMVAGMSILWFFDQYWKSRGRIFGFSNKAWIILFLFSIFPHGHFWFQGYSEPLFVSILFLGLFSVISKRLIWGGFLLGLSAIVRPQGIWLPPIWIALLLSLIFQRKLTWRKGILSALASSVGGVGLILWYWKGTGDPLYYYRIQALGGYGRSFNFLNGIWNHRPRWDTSVLYLYLSLTGSIGLIKKKDLTSNTLGWFSLAFTEVPLFFGGFYSYVRFLSISPSLFLLLTDEYEKSRLREAIIILFFITKLAIQVYKSGYGEWVG